jgi:hypothetical protein
MIRKPGRGRFLNPEWDDFVYSLPQPPLVSGFSRRIVKAVSEGRKNRLTKGGSTVTATSHS